MLIAGEEMLCFVTYVQDLEHAGSKSNIYYYYYYYYTCRD